MVWLLLPLTAGGLIWWWWPTGERVPVTQPALMVQPVPYSPAQERPKHLLSLPPPPLQPEDWPQVEKTVRQAMAQCAPSNVPGLEYEQLFHPLDQPSSAPLVGQMECLLEWLKAQKCVETVRTPMAEAEGKIALRLLTSLPAQVEVEVDFLVEGQQVEPRVLRLIVDGREQLQFVSLKPGALAGP